MKGYFLERMREPSTWRGFMLFLTAVGVPIAPQMAEAIISTGLAITGLIGIVSKG